MLSRFGRGGETALQECVVSVFVPFADARDLLDDDEYRAFVAIVDDRVQLEKARLLYGEALWATRGDR
jgi:hypothetical protein